MFAASSPSLGTVPGRHLPARRGTTLAGYLALLGLNTAGAAAAEALIRMLNRTPARWSP
jgi:hypothetical protein